MSFLFYSNQDFNHIQRVNQNIPGHALSSQSRVSEASPIQLDPPFIGAGELQSLLRVCDPAPHVTLQSAYAPQSDHSPSTSFL